MVGSTTVELPRPVRLWRLYFTKKKKFGFAFNNKAIFNFMNAHSDMEFKFSEFKKYIEENKNTYLIELFYYAHISYCQDNYIKPMAKNLKQFSLCVSGADEKTIKHLAETMRRAEAFGVKEVPGDKKKV